MEAKKWEELGIKDDFLFGKVMQEPKLCKRMIEIILSELWMKPLSKHAKTGNGGVNIW